MDEEFNNLDASEKTPAAGTGKDAFIIRPIRTYEEDVASFVKRGQISTAKIISAEQERQREATATQEVTDARKKSYLALKISGVLVILAGLIVWGIYSVLSPSTGTEPRTVGVSRDVLIDKKEVIEIQTDYKINTEIKTLIINNIKVPPTLQEGEISEILVTKQATETQGEKNISYRQKVSISELLQYLELYPPDTMIRALDEHYLIGSIRADGETVPFVLMRTREYERVFSGMLDWERSLYREINDVFYKTLGTNDFLTFGTTTSPSTVTFDPKKLTDIVLYNRDTRAFIDSQGNILFFYTFINNNHLLLTSKPVVIDLLTKKMNLQNVVR